MVGRAIIRDSHIAHLAGNQTLNHSCVHHSTSRLRCVAVVVFVGLAADISAMPLAANEPTGEEFFERRIRPMLIKHCGRCHGGDVSNPKGALRFDSRQSLLEGGDRGPSIVPGNAEKSLLMRAVRHDPQVDLKMPQGRDRLSEQEIADLARWIDMGAPWPNVEPPVESSADDDEPQQWALVPINDPRVPEVDDRGWSQNEIDRFIWRRLEAKQLSPAPVADRRTLIRRVTFDLIGLPPTPAEVAAFLADSSPGAFARVVERLLSSPHYGERWGRHWLDLMGYAETDGHEYDPDKPDAFRYRDYVIEALNIDLPYDVFLREHLAGDLLGQQRLNLDGAQFATPVATEFYWLGDVQNVPVDEALAVANQVERQIDVIGKAFLGLTLACARCHDHKFDPISTEEYYSLAGFIYSSRRVHRAIDSPDRENEIEQSVDEMRELRQKIAEAGQSAAIGVQREALSMMAEYLLAAAALLEGGNATDAEEMKRAARDRELEFDVLQRWCNLLSEADANRDPIFYPWMRLADQSPSRLARRAAALGESMTNAPSQVVGETPGQEVFEDFEGSDYEGWTPIGHAFQGGPTHDHSTEVQGVIGSGYASSGEISEVLTGRLLSDPFVIRKKYINFLIAGGDFPQRTCLNVIVFGQRLPELTATGDGTGRMRLVSFEVRNLIGREARFELVDDVRDKGGRIAVDRIFFSDQEPQMPPPAPNSVVAEFLKRPGLDNVEDLAQRYEDVVLDVLDKWQEGVEENPQLRRLDSEGEEQLRRFAMGPENPLSTSGVSQEDSIDELRRIRQLERNFPSSATAMIVTDDKPRDMRVHISGQPNNLGDVVPRGVPSCLGLEMPAEPPEGSGRTYLADRIASENNPLTARVMVNRLWKHHFGRGLVASLDNFGMQGEVPSHPELLDWLATRFIQSGWSLKGMHRLMVLSATYQQGNQTTEEAQGEDPENQLLHHMAPRRLEAECVRDAILHVADNLNSRMYGPSVKLYLTPYMEGRSLPEVSGPLDGDRRRSLYLELRRNHLPPILTSFDLPKPESTMGRRATSDLPTQALVMLNNEFVHQQAVAWAATLDDLPDDMVIRIQHIYQRAFAREPDDSEQQSAAEFVTAQRIRYEQLDEAADTAARLAWSDLCHVMFNLAEFMYVR